MTLLKAPMRSRNPRVLEEVRGQVVCEYGSLSGVGTPDRAAVLVHYGRSPKVSRSFRLLVREMATRDYLPIVVSACPAAKPLDWGQALPPQTIVLRKPNVGYDFGSWAVGLHEVPAARRAGAVVLANDSVVGPFASLGPLLDRFERSAADAWALTDTRQYFHHLQSYFLGFRHGVLADEPLVDFWSSIRHHRTKWEIIRRNELALSSLLYYEGYSWTAAFPADMVVRPGENPVIRGWWKLLERGFPFVKREIITNPSVAPRSDWVRQELRARFGVELSEWL